MTRPLDTRNSVLLPHRLYHKYRDCDDSVIVSKRKTRLLLDVLRMAIRVNHRYRTQACSASSRTPDSVCHSSISIRVCKVAGSEAMPRL